MDWTTRKILDHGFIHLVDSMPRWDRPMEQEWGGLSHGDLRVCQAARVSMGHLPNAILQELGLEPPDGEDRTPAHDIRLINYLMKNRHTTPFEKVRLEVVAKLPIFIARQWIRHRCGSFNEMSARYTQLPCEFYLPEPDRMQAQSPSNKQASGAVLDGVFASKCLDDIDEISHLAFERYEHMLSLGLARELARMVLPLNSYTQWYWTVDLHNLYGFLKLRLHPHAQYEIRVYAEALLVMAEHIAPVCTAAFKAHVLHPEEQVRLIEEDAARAKGKLAALIEWADKKRVEGKSITPEDVLASIEALLAWDKEHAERTA